jgi:hypothetical protein
LKKSDYYGSADTDFGTWIATPGLISGGTPGRLTEGGTGKKSTC